MYKCNITNVLNRIQRIPYQQKSLKNDSIRDLKCLLNYILQDYYIENMDEILEFFFETCNGVKKKESDDYIEGLIVFFIE
uniref:Uncharacterized protein n=1 Tax=Strongyloides stercoralis TaxID=6248 RepID=A0A0K0E599_STRER